MSANHRKPVAVASSQQSTRDSAPSGRFGVLDRRGAWHGRPQETGTDEVAADPQQPRDTTKVTRILLEPV